MFSFVSGTGKVSFLQCLKIGESRGGMQPFDI